MAKEAPQGQENNEGGGAATLISPSRARQDEFEEEFETLANPVEKDEGEESLDTDDDELELGVVPNEETDTGDTKPPDESADAKKKPAPDHDWQKRYGDLLRFQQGQKDKDSGEIARLEAELKESQSGEGSQSDDDNQESENEDDFESFSEYVKSELPEDDRVIFDDNPAIGKSLDGYLQKVTKKFKGKNVDIDKIVSEKLEQERTRLEDADIERRNSEFREKVADEITDFEERINDPAFQDWRNQNDAQVQSVLSNHDTYSTKGLVEVFALYDEEVEFKTDHRQKREKKLKRMTASPKSKTGNPNPSPDDDDFEGAFEHYANKT